jgi:hypothetical protein
MILYELALLGSPTNAQTAALEAEVSKVLAPFALTLDKEVSLQVGLSSFAPSQRHASAALFFGSAAAVENGLPPLLEQGIPVIPIASKAAYFFSEMPPILRPINGLSYVEDGPQRISSALLECAGLLPRQRRVFVSYRRQEARGAALQLFDAFSARQFDVFLDTHGIPPAEDFQAMLWHRLCDSDVLVMIDTPGYFDSRWTAAEFGRALAKNISVLRVGWPGCSPSPRAAMIGAIDIAPSEIDAAGHIADAALDRICRELETRRSESIAVRHLNLVGELKQGVQRIGGKVLGVGLHKCIHIALPDGTDVVAYPTTGTPTSTNLQDAAESARAGSPAIVYDHVGLHSEYLGHLNWLGKQIPNVRLVRACEVAWQFADWRH